MAISTKMTMTHRWRDDDVNGDDVESRIQFYLEAYKHYIIQCINPDDLLFYEHFSPENRKYFRQLSTSSQSSICAISEMIDTIVTMDVPGRFSSLLQLFETEFENEKVSRILKGEKTPTNRRENKEKIQKICTPEICKNLNVAEIIPHLIQEKLILENEGNCLKSNAEKGNQLMAAFDLLFILPHRHPNWYTRFLSCLIKSGHYDIAKLINEHFCEKISLDLSTRCKNGEKTTDYHDEQMSLASGPVSVRPKSLKDDENTRPISPTSIFLEDKTNKKVEPTSTSTAVTKGVSPEHERVANWLISSQDMVEVSDNENRCSSKSTLKAEFKKRLSKERTGSYLGERPLQRAKSKRHQTLQVPINQIAMMQAMFSKAPSKALSVYKSYYGSQSDLSDCSRRTSMISSVESLDRLSVDKEWDLQMTVDDNDNTMVNVEMTNTLKMISDLERSSDADETTHDNTAHSSTKDEETVVHEDSVRIERAIQTEAVWKPSTCPTFQQLLTVSFMHPVKLTLLVKEFPGIHSLCAILRWMSQRTIELDDFSLSLKAHYISTVIDKLAAENIDTWIENLLTGRESDGYFEHLDELIRAVLNEYEHKESWIFKTIMSEMELLDLGDGLSSLRIVTHILQRNVFSTREPNTLGSSENAEAVTDNACNTTRNAETVTQKKCKLNGVSLTSKCSTKMTYKDTELKNNDFKEHFRHEDDQIEEMNGNSTEETERKRYETKTDFVIERKNCGHDNSKACNRIVKISSSSKTTVSKGKTAVCASNIGHVNEPKLCRCFFSDEVDSLSKSGVSAKQMSPDSPAFKVVTEKRFKDCSVKIVCIHRIRNENLRSRYTNQKKLLSGQSNERYLFHGTKYMKAIIEGGFDIMCSEQGLEELYFSNNPLMFEKVLDQNSGSNFNQRNSPRRILLCSVCLGKTRTETDKFVVANADKDAPSDHNSLRSIENVDNKCCLKYKVIHGDQVYPEYLVTYETIMR